MKILKTTIVTAFFFSLSIGTINSQSVNYKILEDNPYDHNLDVAFMPFYVDMASKSNNLSLGYGLNATQVYKKLATFRLYALKPYAPTFDWGYHFGTVGIFDSPTINKLKKFLHLELGGTYHLSERTVNKNRKVVLSSHSGYKTTTTTYITVPATVRKIFGVRGGIYNYHTAITARQNGDIDGDLGIDAKGVISTDGTRFGGAALLNDGGSTTDPFYNTESATNMKVLGAYGGISSTSYYKIFIDTDGYGKKGGFKSMNFFADAMFAPVRIDDFVGTDGKKYDVSGKGAQGFKTRPFGARLGLEYSMGKNKIGYYARMEAGFKPGLANSKFYVSLGFGICFLSKIQKLASE
ncbi:MAG: hypothetical protein V4547_10720 [Bacteroidota bacterium]